jgi:hypothetical protein
MKETGSGALCVGARVQEDAALRILQGAFGASKWPLQYFINNMPFSTLRSA